MLASEHSIVKYVGARVVPDRLTQSAHAGYVEYAKMMLEVYSAGKDKPRHELHASIDGILARVPGCPTRRISAFKRLLDDASEYETDPDGAAASLRLQVFAMAAQYHPLVVDRDMLFDSAEREVKGRIANQLGTTWEEIEGMLYTDVIARQPLRRFVGYPDERALLSRYNVAQLQAALYGAERMRVYATRDFRRILRHAKFARLMLDVKTRPRGAYEIELTGPASVLMNTRRYGVSFARFLPGLLACDAWEAEAVIRTPRGRKATLELSSDDGYTSNLGHLDGFDSDVEERFAHKFGAGERRGWRIEREGAILHRRQSTFVPDFVFRHDDGSEVLMEIVGFWTPEYLKHKRATIEAFKKHRILLAVPKATLKDGFDGRGDVVVYGKALLLEPVLQALERLRACRREE
jgi:predicted nuclease of restriction endonuclease-like RecB superfamily